MRIYYRIAVSSQWKTATTDFLLGTQLMLNRYWMWQWQRDEVGYIYLTYVPGIL